MMNTYLMNASTDSIDPVHGNVLTPTDSKNVAARVNVQVVRPHSLCGPLLEDWERIRKSKPVFASPYFDVEFTKAVGRVRDDVRIAIAENDGDIVGILPFQEHKRGHAVPVGGLLNDWHGVMGDQSPAILEKILKASKLKSFKFHAIDNSNDGLKKFYFREFNSHYLDLSNGWEEYRKWAFKNSSTIKRQGQKTRGLGREVGEVRFEFESEDPLLLERLIELKRARYQNADTFDILGVPWASDVLREIHRIREPNFRGVLSALWAGDELIGCHFGMLTKGILHYWFPVYDPQYHRYSPGTEMLMQSAKSACDSGIRKLDLGYGDDAYKFKFCNAHEPVAFGLVNFNSFSRIVAKQRYTFRNQLKQIPMKPLAKRILRTIYPHFGGWNFR